MPDASKYLTVLRTPQVYAQWLLLRDLHGYFRLQFLYAAFESGLLREMARPRTLGELAAAVGVTRPDILESLLDLGVALKELSRRGAAYQLRGRRSRALASTDGDALAAMAQEMLTYHSDVYLQLRDRMRGVPPGDYLGEQAAIIARSSRILEPYIAHFVGSIVRERGPLRLLEVGCGTGVHIRHAVEANAEIRGVGVDVQPEVVAMAGANLAAWGLTGRFSVVHGDIRRPPPEVVGGFDLITMHQNIYYFEEEERTPLFQRIREWLRPGGRFVLTSFMRANTLSSLDMDIALRCTAGCTGLPNVEALAAQLRQAGFTLVESSGLMPLEPLYGILASQPVAE